MAEAQNQSDVDHAVQDALRDAQNAVSDIQHELDNTLGPDIPSQTSGVAPGASAPDGADETYGDTSGATSGGGGIELLSDVDLDVMIELGRTEMLVEDVLRLGSGSVVELDKLAGDPVDVHVNGRLVARGEVLVLNDNFCIRISEIIENLEEQAAAAAAEAQEASQATMK